MKNIKNIFIILLLICIFFLTRFSKPVKEVIKNVTLKVLVPERKGISDTVYLPSPIRNVYIKNPINKKLLINYNKAKDSIKELLYKDAISINDYKEVFKDSTQKIEVYTKVQGKLLKQHLNYVIKEDSIKVNTKVKIKLLTPKNKLFMGVEVGSPIFDIKPIVKANLLLKNKKDNIISISYDTNKNVWVGYYIKF